MQLGFLKPAPEDRDFVEQQVRLIREKTTELETEMKKLNQFLESKGLALSGPNVLKYRQSFDGIGAASWQMNLIKFKCKIPSRTINLEWI